MPVDKFGRMSDTKTKDTGVSLTYINNNYIRSDGNTPVTGSIDMKGNTLYNVSDPVNPQDVATKEYADNVRGGGLFLKENDNYRATHTINMAYNKLVNLQKPTEPYDATTKDYVDFVAKSLNVEEALVKENGGYNIINNAYINMNSGNIRNVAEPSLISDVATKGYVDETVVNTVTSQIKQLNQLVSVSASYYGKLVKGEYQFTFGGPSLTENNFLQRYNGFLVPTFGVIKHFAIKPSGLKLEITENVVDSLTKSLIRKYGLVDNPTPLYTLVLIKDDIGEVIDVGTLFFYFTNFTNIFFTDKNRLSGDLDINFQFKSKKKNLDKTENFICSVNKGDIVNIRSEFTEENSVFNEDGDYIREIFPFALNKDYYKVENRGNILDDSFTHLATLTFLFKEMSFPNVLELDPL